MFDQRSPSLTVVIQHPEVDVVDGNGGVVQHLAEERRAYGITLLGAAHDWKINGFVVSEQFLPEEFAEVIALGVP